MQRIKEAYVDTCQVTIELFGIPRQRAGIASLTVDAATLGDAMRCLEASCPQLTGLTQEDGSLSPHYLLSIDGERFVRDMRERVPPATRLLLLSADAGG
jgi:molybdopterin converting factor small subunit